MGLMKKLTSAIVASSLVLSLVGTAAAAYTPAAGETAGKRMQDLKILMGKPGVGLDLNGEITRAELVTVIVRAFGKEADAQLLKGSTAFPDIANHWASGNIAMAKALVEKAGSDAIGMPDGTFAPDAKLTAAQAVAFLMKFVGVKADASKTWPANYLDVAVEKNIITAEDKTVIAPQLNANATRGLVFYMFDRAFYSYNLPTGKTFYTQYVDTMGPEVTLNAIDATTIDSKVTVTGNVKDAVSVFVGTTAVTPDASGNFSANYDLPELKDYTITVTARDLAGNTTEKSAKVTRAAGTASVIEVSDITVAAGATAEVKAVVKDAKGNVVTATVTGTATTGTFADGKYTAGKVVGTDTLTLKVGDVVKEVKVTTTAGAIAKVVADKASVAPGAIVTLSAQDEFGNAITGATFSQTSADAMLDGASGKFMASKAGSYKVTATANGKSVDTTIGVFGAVTKVVVSAPAQVVGNTSAAASYTGSLYTITGTVADTNGNAVTTGTDATQNLTLTLPTGFTLDASTAATQAAKDGVVTWKVKADQTAVGSVGTFVVDAANVGAAGSDDGHTNVEVIAQVATSVKLATPTNAFIRSNSASSNVTTDLSILDQNGKRFLGAGQTISLSLTGPGTFTTPTLTAKTSGDIVYAGGVVTVTFNSLVGQTGAITLTATSAGLGNATATVTSAIASTAKLIKVAADKTEGIAAQNTSTDGTITYTVQVTDANGVPVAGTFALKGTANTDSYAEIYVNGVALAAKTWNLSTDAEGKATFTVKANAFVGALGITVADNASLGLTAQDLSVNFKADVATQVLLTKTAVNVAAANPTVTLTAQLKDAAGNKVAKSGVKVTFTGNYAAAASDLVTLNGTAKTVDVLTDANGVATVNTSVLGYYSYAYTVTMASTGLTTNTTTITVTNSVAATITASIRNWGDTLSLVSAEAGTPVLIKATVKDSAGRAIVGDTVKLTVAKESAYPSAAGTVNTAAFISSTAGLTATTDASGNVSFELAPVKAGVFTFTLTDSNSATSVTQAISMNIAPKLVTSAGTAAKLVVVEADSANTVEVTAGKLAGPYTVKLQDMYGNDLIATSNTTISLTPSVAGPTGIRATADGIDAATLTIPAGTSQTTFYVMTGAAADYSVTFGGTYATFALTNFVLTVDK